MSMSGIEIVECTTPKLIDEFIFFQWIPYKGNPYWCPPLISERRDKLKQLRARKTVPDFIWRRRWTARQF